MARLHEYQGKALLAQHRIAIPRGSVARSPEQARDIARDLGCPTVLKVQAWITGRKARGGVRFAQSPDEAAGHVCDLLSMKFGNFPVTEILVEEMLPIRSELFISLSVDDAAQAPVLLLDCEGGSGIEQRAATVARIPISILHGIDKTTVRKALSESTIDRKLHDQIIEVIETLVELARHYEARSFEINPLVITEDGRVVAADCRLTVDDYSVFRHPELGIEIARELDHPATDLERAAYEIEMNDHRGTFYFAQLPTDEADTSRGIIGFHGAGGGGSMMSMDAVTNEGFTLANFCDTSGNPSAAKVYRAARIILAQPDLAGYFGSGSGVASQEQYHSAYGLAKAFIETRLDVPAVLRLGGNSEDRAVEILQDACRDLPTVVEGYRKDDTPAACARRFRELVEQAGVKHEPRPREVPDFVGGTDAYSFPLSDGSVWIDHANCNSQTSQLVVRNSAGLLRLSGRGKPVLAISEEDIAGSDSELIACEIECRRAGKPIVFVDLPIPLLDRRH